MANVAVRANPALAHRLAAWDGRVQAAFAEAKFSAAPTGDINSDIAAGARKAIRQDATALDALNVLGAQAQLRQDPAEARTIFGHELKLSRRELSARLWAIEEAASRGDVASAVDNYDIALRTSSKAPEVLFPILASAISEPRIRTELIARWRGQRPEWASEFIAHAAASSRTPLAVVALLNEARAVGLQATPTVRVALINNLVNNEQTAAAWRFYASSSPGARADESRDPQFRADPREASMFDWTVTEYASIQTGQGSAGLVEIGVPPAASGPLLQQFQVLPPGRYVLSTLSSGIEQPTISLPFWEIRCASGQVLLRDDLPQSIAGQKRRSTAEFSVPKGCGAQFLTLFAKPTDAIAGVNGRIESARIMPKL